MHAVVPTVVEMYLYIILQLKCRNFTWALLKRTLHSLVGRSVLERGCKNWNKRTSEKGGHVTRDLGKELRLLMVKILEPVSRDPRAQFFSIHTVQAEGLVFDTNKLK